MHKRYQVFISSTFNDLKSARHEVSQALLETDCFPAGMELFPAADDEQMDFIKKIIDQSDYYLLIIAGRYGSQDPTTKLSYTEMEYDYAVKKRKPIIALIHQNPDEIPLSQSEKNEEDRKKLAAFRQKVQTGRIVKYWKTPSELGKEAIVSLNWAKNHKPATGWVRADGIATKDAELRISELEKELLALKSTKEKYKPIDSLLTDSESEFISVIAVKDNNAKSEIKIRKSEIIEYLICAVYNNSLLNEINYQISLFATLNSNHFEVPGVKGLIFDSYQISRLLTELETEGALERQNEIITEEASIGLRRETLSSWHLNDHSKKWAAKRILTLCYEREN
ncbi:protein of unknown function [Stappia sp. ES.058]|nr:protein of unknown function [Stappia sp. ES.058]